MLIRRFFAFVISAFLIFFPAYSYANTSVGGWSAVDVITAGATTTINATKTAGGKVLNSAITIAPQAGKVGQYLIKGGGQAAIAYAMVELADGAIDWVLDPANNRVIVTNPASDGDAPAGKGWRVRNGPSTLYSNPTAAATEYCAAEGKPLNKITKSSGTLYQFECPFLTGSVDLVDAGNYPVLGSDSNKTYIPIETVAAQVISNSESGHAPSQEAVKAAALEGFAAGEHDAALDAAATESDAGTENPPDTADPDAPAEPFDPAGIISAINALKALLAGILSSITSMADSLTGFFDWVQGDVPPEDEPKEVPFATTDDIGIDDNVRFEQRIEFNGQCPVNDFSFSMMGVTYSKPIPYYHLCGFLEQIAPWLLAMTYLGAAYFVTENL